MRAQEKLIGGQTDDRLDKKLERAGVVSADPTAILRRMKRNRTITSGDSPTTDEQCMAIGYFFPATKSLVCIDGPDPF